ncbi:MAG: acyltransferase [Bacteroidaceae bacterium]|nr:acyltransferase [Bacteroidaceae bacterium]
MTQTSFYSEEELQTLGFKSIGKGCRISRKACFYGIESMTVGDNVRIDDFCILSGGIILGSNIHISAYVALYGSKGIVMEDFTGISSRTTVYSAMDDFSGEYLVGPIHPEGMTRVTGGPVIIRQFSQIGAHCVVMPSLTLAEGTVIGAMSFVRHSTEPWGIYFGVPARFIRKRTQGLKNFANTTR